MECFIKKVWEGKGEETHDQFIRFSKGHFEYRAALNLQKSKKIKLRGSFEWVNDFAEIVSELADLKFSGIVSSKEEIDEELKGHDDGVMCEFDKSVKRGINVYVMEDLPSKMISKIKDKVYTCLLYTSPSPRDRS